MEKIISLKFPCFQKSEELHATKSKMAARVEFKVIILSSVWYVNVTFLLSYKIWNACITSSN